MLLLNIFLKNEIFEPIAQPRRFKQERGELSYPSKSLKEETTTIAEQFG